MKNRNIIFTTILLVLGFLALLPTAQGVVPAPDGGYPGGNTAEGQNALLSLNVNTGTNNTAVGSFSLKSNVQGQLNTAVGAGTLFSNTAHRNTAIGGAALFSNTEGQYNTAVGSLTLLNNTTGILNTAIGDTALFSNTEGFYNTAAGVGALFDNTTGEANTAIGYQALYSNTFGIENTANGFRALYNNTTGGANTANGVSALYSNTTGGGNTANGHDALYHNTTGEGNTANGILALFSNTEGNANTANGSQTLASNTIGRGNTANGYQALHNNTSGGNNTANGLEALFSNSTGEANTANGRTALRSNTTGGFNTAIGRSALFDNTSGGNNIALGYLSGANLTTGDYNIDIGNLGFPNESRTIRIGSNGTQTRTFIAGIREATAAGGATVFVDSAGQLGTLTSSRRFKDQIKPMDKASEALLALNPVSFRYKKEIDREGIPQFGLVAEEVAKINPALIVRDKEGKPYSVRYEQVNAMLLNEFLKEHRTVQELKSAAAKQEKTIAQQQKQIEALTVGLQKVSAQIETSKPAPKVVLNNP
jgi:trimeric autotransporter adhesin